MNTPSRPEIEAQLALILKSGLFTAEKNPRKLLVRGQLLDSLVMRTLNGEPVDSGTIREKFFKKKPDDLPAPADDPIVKVHVSEIRMFLEEYYAKVGNDNVVRISIPHQTNMPVFEYSPDSPAMMEVKRGYYFLDNHIGEQSWGYANVHFDAAIRLQPELALAYAGKALALFNLGLETWTDSTIEEVGMEAKAVALKALKFSPNFWAAHASMGAIHSYLYEWESADAEFKIALEKNAIETRMFPDYGFYLLARGRYKEALEIAEMYARSYRHDPWVSIRGAWYLYLLRRYDAAFWLAWDVRAPQEVDNVLRRQGDWVMGLASIALEKTPNERLTMPDTHKDWKSNGLKALWGVKNGLLDLANESLLALDHAENSAFDNCLGAIARFESERALEWLERMCEQKDPTGRMLHLIPVLDPLRKYPRFHDLVRKTGLPKVTKEELV
jgi:tetratricopeptide (TPR) repeat protein